MALVAAAGSWFAIKRQQVERQRAAVRAIEGMGGNVEYDWQDDARTAGKSNADPPGPAWLRVWLGDDFFADVVFVAWPSRSEPEPKNGIEALDDLPHVKAVLFHDGVLPESALESLGRLTKLEEVSFFSTGMSAAELNRLGQLTQLKKLYLANIETMTDAALGHLTSLTQLTVLVLECTRVTDAGLEHLKALTQLQELYLGHTKVTDAGLKHLRSLKRLRLVVLQNTQVTDNGVKKLQEALPNCLIAR
jgi:Leucine-rich repeat (LRR) protein